MMKTKIKHCIIFCFLLWSCGHHDNSTYKLPDTEEQTNGISEQQKANLPKFLFENTTHNLGEIIQGKQVTDTFHFKNIGNSNLLISDVKTSCGCTTTSPLKEPVKPGEEGKVPVSFDTTNKDGEGTVYVIVTANTYPAQTVLTIKANVVKQ